MIGQLNMLGMTKIEYAIKNLQAFEPPDGYYLAFSGGKDSAVVYRLAELAGVRFDAHFNHTSVEAPDTIYYIREHFPDVSIDFPRDKKGKRITMWTLIPQKGMPPTRICRYCCSELKETGGKGRMVITGVRKAESANRSRRSTLEVSNKDRTQIDPDNEDASVILKNCYEKQKIFLNPIIDWTDEDVWEFIAAEKIPINPLYSKGFNRVGCIGCPMASVKKRQKQFEMFPKFKNLYLKAFEKIVNDSPNFKTADSIMEWWLQ